jgi:hypothetical protein
VPFVFAAPAGLQWLVSATERLSVAPGLVPSSGHGSAIASVVAPLGGIIVSSVPSSAQSSRPAPVLGPAIGSGPRLPAPGSVACPGPFTLPSLAPIRPSASRPAACDAAIRRPVTPRPVTLDCVSYDADEDEIDAIEEMDETDLAVLDDYDMADAGENRGMAGIGNNNCGDDEKDMPPLETLFGARSDASTHATRPLSSASNGFRNAGCRTACMHMYSCAMLTRTLSAWLSASSFPLLLFGARHSALLLAPSIVENNHTFSGFRRCAAYRDYLWMPPLVASVRIMYVP